MYLANNPASHRGVMNDAPRPDKIKGRIGKFDNLRVHPARIRLQTLKRHPARRRVNRSLRDVDSCYIGARSREPLSVQARSTANFEDSPTSNRFERNYMSKRTLSMRKQSMSNNESAINLVKPLRREPLRGNPFIPVVRHGVVCPPLLIGRLCFGRRLFLHPLLHLVSNFRPKVRPLGIKPGDDERSGIGTPRLSPCRKPTRSTN